MRLFLLPHTLVGIGAILFVLRTLLWIAAGHNVEATVTSARQTTTHSKGGTHQKYTIQYAYSDGPVARSGEGDVSSAYYASLPAALKLPSTRYNVEAGPSPAVTVRVLSVGFASYAHPVFGSVTYGSELGGALFFALFWNGIVSVFVYMLWIAPWRQRRLLIHGRAVVGEVTCNRGSKGKWTIEYIYCTPEGTSHSGSASMTGKEHPAHGPAIVVYDENRPKRSLLYAAALWQLRDA